jgi:PAS domain S-box-containing protein
MNMTWSETTFELANWLERKRWLITRRWLRLVRSDPAIENTGRLTNAQLVDYLPEVFAELCAALRTSVPRANFGHVERDARKHGRHRWLHGYQIDELFRELDLLQKCTQEAARQFFEQPDFDAQPAQDQARAHQLIEDLFSSMIYGAIRQLLEEQNERIDESLRARDLALAAQQDSEERLRVAAAAAGLGIFEWDVVKRMAVWENARMYEITGQKPEDGPMPNDEFIGIVYPDDVSQLVRQLESSRPAGQQVHAFFRIFRKHDHALRFLEMYGSFRYALDGDAHAFIGTLADITDRKTDEERLREMDRRKDAFLATLAHELRNPLAPIRNAAHVLRHHEASLPHEAAWVPSVVERQIVHLSRLIDDLLEVSRITTGKITLKRRVFDAREAVSGALEINGPNIDAHAHRITVSMPDEPVSIDGDQTRITQVLSNLLDNAIKYTPDGGAIHVTVGFLTDKARHAALVTVDDTGIGISAAELPHVFDLFVQAADRPALARGGLGIGLSVVRTLVGMHGGHVTATSAGPGKGSRFSVRLPLASAPALPAPIPPRDVLVADGQPASDALRILIVDDNRDAAESLAIVLEQYHVRTAADGARALEAIGEPADANREFAWDVVLLDLGLPGMSGYEVAERIKGLTQLPSPVLIALTGSGHPEDIARSRAAGFREHLVKPVDLDTLIRLLQQIAEERQAERD